jgi:hypothetical protein
VAIWSDATSFVKGEPGTRASAPVAGVDEENIQSASPAEDEPAAGVKDEGFAGDPRRERRAGDLGERARAGGLTGLGHC